MDPGRLQRVNDCEWMLPQTGAMRVPGVIFADETLIREMDDKVPEQVANVATLPGIVKASFAMPDAHWGYGFPIYDVSHNTCKVERHVVDGSPSLRGVAEEAPDAYKDVSAVVDAAGRAQLARKVARLEPLVCIKG